MIELRDVTKKYGTITALQNVNLKVKEGEFFALLGPNGAGKTTILRILLDFTHPTSGSAFINGISCSNPDARCNVGYLPENLAIPGWICGYDYLMRHALLYGMNKDVAHNAIDRVIETVGMKGRERHAVGTYSKGMTQRIGLAAALIASPNIIILDEPGNGLDPIGTREFRIILENMKNRGVTLLLNSHILSEVEKISTSAAIVNNGRIVVQDTIANLVREGESLEDVFIRVAGRGSV
ncbi:MAG TPA: ABC transporter ATP-binding protein [Chitinispirillaceae bacterium]|nr:ABC transporter ATP-binding protein [Chitinispirillaceae bacterium]